VTGWQCAGWYIPISPTNDNIITGLTKIAMPFIQPMSYYPKHFPVDSIYMTSSASLRRLLTLPLQPFPPSPQPILPQLDNLLLDLISFIRYPRLLLWSWPEIQMSNILFVEIGMAKVIHCTDREHDVHAKFEDFEVWTCHCLEWKRNCWI